MTRIEVSLTFPESKSPVPTLCSVHAVEGRGDFGDPAYRGNCSGLLIRDLLKYFTPRNLLDPMEGSGTSGDVARSLGIPYQGFDLRTGFDATDAKSFDGLGGFDMIWLHPPYFDLIKYNEDSRCLSQAGSVAAFFDKLEVVIRNCARVLTEHGHLAILMGDIVRRGYCHGLPFHAWAAATLAGFELACPEIIRLSHGAKSTGKKYCFPLIPRVHDVCLVLRRKVADQPYQDTAADADVEKNNKLAMGHLVKESLIRNAWPSTDTMEDFGLSTTEHFAALQFAIIVGGIHVDQLAEVARNGPAISKLVKSVPGNPWKEVVFRTEWDERQAVQYMERRRSSDGID